VIEKYRVGNDASTASSSGAQAAKLTDVGK
jgi:hypothetical protein